MVLTQKIPKYTILNSSYLIRLINRFELVRYNLDNGEISLASEDPDHDYNLEEDEEDYKLDLSEIKPIFLWTSYTKDAIYCSANLDVEKYQDDISKIFAIERAKGSLCGMIVFENGENKPHSYVTLLDTQEYCACFSAIDTIIYYDNNELFAIEYKIDGESG